MNGTRSRDLEIRSSAITLSDMEVFIFPELMFGLVLANILSPRIWRWREDPWFAGLERMKPYRRITRLKQYIMDHYVFNLDLDTWGLTTKDKELARFRDFIGEETLARSNALFGYEGDKYYFDIDIRTHFGLDKYEGNVIPYWKTETVEAMDAFRHKPDYACGAGECVSLAVLYAAALFVVARIPLKDIYLMATPLHSQNFIDVDDGILTNNRRLVTKNMWFNGTALSAQARRALENERVTIVTHETGHVHTVYPRATMDAQAYRYFSGRLRGYLQTELTGELLGNFLRDSRDIQKCFQIRRIMHGVPHYLEMERLFAYEHGSPFMVTDNTREKLLADIEMEEFRETLLPSRIVLNDLEDFIREEGIDINASSDVVRLKEKFASDCLNAEIAIECLRRFCHADPRLPDPDAKTFVREEEPLSISLDMTREEMIDRLASIRDSNVTADLAFYAFRDLSRTAPEPFVLAAVERNPVSIAGSQGMDRVAERVAEMPAESIYDGPGRLAQPDEVWNFGRGDGVEKALLLANIFRSRLPEAEMALDVAPDKATLRVGRDTFSFSSAKQLAPGRWVIPKTFGPPAVPASC